VKTISADKRVLSVDVLYGFDMFWLIGGTGLALAIVKLSGGWRTLSLLFCHAGFAWLFTDAPQIFIPKKNIY
jgi:hypothetical protein